MSKNRILKIICFIIFLQAFTLVVNSQTMVIKGDIINESDNRGIPNINVFLKNTQIGTKLFSMSMYLLYDIHLHSDKIFRIKEEKGGLFSKKKIELKDNDVNLNFINGNSPWDSFDVGNAQFGVLLKFN